MAGGNAKAHPPSALRTPDLIPKDIQNSHGTTRVDDDRHSALRHLAEELIPMVTGGHGRSALHGWMRGTGNQTFPEEGQACKSKHRVSDQGVQIPSIGPVAIGVQILAF